MAGQLRPDAELVICVFDCALLCQSEALCNGPRLDGDFHPGESVELKVASFDDHGPVIGEVEAEWSKGGPRPRPFIPPERKATPPPKVSCHQGPCLGTRAPPRAKGTKLTIAKAPAGQFGTGGGLVRGLTA